MFSGTISPMCNLYSVAKSQAAIREAYAAMVDRTGNLAPLPSIFPNQMAPVVRNGADGRELALPHDGRGLRGLAGGARP